MVILQNLVNIFKNEVNGYIFNAFYAYLSYKLIISFLGLIIGSI